MDTKIICKGKVSVLTIKGEGLDTLLSLTGIKDEKNPINSQYKGNMATLMANLMHVSENGLNVNGYYCKYIDTENKIIQFKPGRLRLLCFPDGDSIVVCAHAFMKKTQKTPQAHINKAIRLKDKYFRGK